MAIIERENDKQGALISILQQVQEEYGYLPEKILHLIARRTQNPESKVMATASFYSQFRFEPSGRFTIKVCQGTACHISGASKLLDVLEEELGIAEGETTKDRLFTLETVACLGCCSLAPVIMINETAYGRLTTNKVKKIINDFRNGRTG
ncbi:MAG: NADH-quinone oxidoreductase subunit NuoE [Spirochaetes bacterium]|nr:NADH-quinone oxidoreductase subunit NuoE [Spirochaetota bacterium]